MAWIYLLLAALCETAWTFCLKLMKFSDLKALRLANVYRWHGGGSVISPFVGYLVFGLANIYLFSMAIKQISTATAFAVWTAVTLLLIKIAETTFFNQRTSWIEVFFLMLIMVGIIGLKTCAMQVK
ncbi:SMR family transporter [Mucilaginibacter sp.]|uniref:DMT family transporter n=1 Tax=Mucilaginibacter sp. TaxID=1882438 RepID=UPI0025DEF9D5|nr:SMR family transporter [Mucilaginibacter sp.]